MCQPQGSPTISIIAVVVMFSSSNHRRHWIEEQCDAYVLYL
jgi:hypothetical protein